jgi:hypothetical protein
MTVTKSATPSSYEALYQNKELGISGLLLLVVVMLGIIGLAVAFIEDGNDALPVILGAIGAMVVGTIVLLLFLPRVHRWTIEPTGVRIAERAKIMGPRREGFVAFSDIAALRNLESGFDGVIELVTRDGKIWRLMRPRSPLVKSAALEALPDLQAFGATLSQAIAVSGATPVPMTEGLSFWNRGGGLAIIVGFLIFSIPLAGLTLWALFDGGLEYRARMGEAIAIFVLLPFGVGYMLHKSLKRRRRVLSGQGGAASVK